MLNSRGKRRIFFIKPLKEEAILDVKIARNAAKCNTYDLH
jgi:hypothetical protein